MIQNFINNKTRVALYTINGYRMQGIITDSLSDYIIFNGNTLVYKHAISTIQPV